MYVHQIGKLGVHVFSMTSMGIAKESKAAAKNDEGDDDEKRGDRKSSPQTDMA